MKKLFPLLILALIITALLVSCGGDGVCAHTDADFDERCDKCGEAVLHTSHTDADSDGKCDKCDVDMPLSDLVLLEDGIASFKFVLAGNLSYNARQTLSGHIDRLKAGGTTVKAVEDKETNLSEYEILIGDVQTRGNEYFFDEHKLGMEGYAIKRIGNKIIIVAGSSDIMPYAIDAFFSDVLGFGESVREVPQNVIYGGDVIEIQDNYAITSIKVLNNSLADYVIYVEPGSSERDRAAQTLRDALYVNAGYYLEIVDTIEGTDRYVRIGAKDRVKGDKGFSITVDEGENLNILCAYDSKLEKAIDDFLIHNVKIASGEVVFGADYLYEYEVSVITYEEYGAKGDGKTDDASAIRQAHRAANEGGQTVVAKNGATYFIKSCTTPISIKTDVNWGSAKFIIEDNFSGITINNIFELVSDYQMKLVTDADSIKKIFGGTTIDRDTISKLNWEDYGYPALVYPTDKTHRNYIRYGESGSTEQCELIKVDKNGNIDESTPFLFDYTNISSLRIIRTDDTPITVKGGIFTTRPKQGGSVYFSRGIKVYRSNSVIDGIQHYVEGDTTKSAPYSGFLAFEDCDNIRVENSVFTARLRTVSGTYDIGCYNANNITLYKCTQSNFFLEDGVTTSMEGNKYWGVMQSNGCKNITYDTCRLTRFDAHMGLYNGKIINSEVCVLEIIGGGDMIIENTTIYQIKGRIPIELRHDYGSTWKGTITLKNINIVTHNTTSLTLVTASWENHKFGYTCYMPNVILDGITVSKDVEKVYIYWTSNGDDGTEKETLNDGTPNKNPRVAPEFVKVINDSGYTVRIPNYQFLHYTRLEGEVEVAS